MIGWVHEVIQQLVLRKYGKGAWSNVITQLDAEVAECDVNKSYSDEQTSTLIAAVSRVTGTPREDFLESYGAMLIEYSMNNGWDELLREISSNLQGFLQNLHSLHYFIDNVAFRTQLHGPSFRCENSLAEEHGGSIVFHYYSIRRNLSAIVRGAICELARRIFSIKVAVKIHSQNEEMYGPFYHVVFHIYQIKGIRASFCVENKIPAPTALNTKNEYFIDLMDFCEAFPHHICFDSNLRIQHVGNHIQIVFPNITTGETVIGDILELMQPQIPFNFDSMLAFHNSVFVFRLKEHLWTRGKTKRSSSAKPTANITLKDKSMQQLNSGNYLCYMCSLNVTRLRELIDRGLYLSDIQRHDSTRDLIMLNHTRMSQMELNEKIEETTRQLQLMASELEKEKKRTEDLLCELMPRSVADSLRHGHTVIASEFAEATVLFSDIVTFTNICAMCTPYDVVNMLNDLYSRFDHLVGFHNVYKVETIGDAYMIAGGVPEKSDTHCERVLNTALGMLAESRQVVSPITQQPINIRIGVHAGPLVAGVVGVKMPRYCLFGHTIHIANQLESKGIPGRVQVSVDGINIGMKTNPQFRFTERGFIELKGFGTIQTYFLEGNDKLSNAELCGRPLTDVKEAPTTRNGQTVIHSQIFNLSLNVSP